MTILQITYAPHPIFRQAGAPIRDVNADIRSLVDNMFDTLYFEQAVGLGAHMIGVAKRIAVVDLQEDGERKPYTFINPEITWTSEETQTVQESSLSFPYIAAEITRPKAIKVSYTDYDGKPQQLEAEGFFATVIQHELDYLDGRTFLDHLSRMKRDMLLKKMQKQMKLHPPHVHGEHCHHG